MRQPLGRLRARVPVGLLVLLLVLAIVHVWWLVHVRAGGPVEYDEAGYLAIAFRDLHGAQDAGATGLVHAVLGQAPEAPLVPLLAVPTLALGGGALGAAWAVEVVALLALVAVTAALARQLVEPRLALLAAAVVGTIPIVTDFSRLFHFAVPATALLTAATWSVLRSDGLLRHRWAISAGALLGLMVLARTMTLAYLPGVGGAALLLALLRPVDRTRRLVGWGLLVATTAVVASSWYLTNARSVASYLIGTGYGARAAEYGPQSSPLSPTFWVRGLGQLVRDARLPLAVVLVVAGGTACVAAWPSVRAAFRSRRPLALLNTDAGFLVVIVVEGYLALTSTRNQGTAFSMPWLPALVVLAVAGLAHLHVPVLRGGVSVALLAVSVGALLVQSSLVGVARPVTVRVPSIGEVAVLDPRGLIHREVESLDPAAVAAGGKLPPVSRGLRPLAASVAAAVLQRADRDGRATRLLDAVGDPLINSTRYALEANVVLRRSLAVGSFHPRDGAQTVGSDRALLTADGAPFLMTGQVTGVASFGIVQAQVVAAAQQAGYRVVDAFRTPDGRTLQLWESAVPR